MSTDERRTGAADGAPADRATGGSTRSRAAQRAKAPIALRGEVRVTIERREAGGQAPRRDRIHAEPSHRRRRWPRRACSPCRWACSISSRTRRRGPFRSPATTWARAAATVSPRVPQIFYPGSFDADTAYDNVLDFSPLGSVANTPAHGRRRDRRHRAGQLRGVEGSDQLDQRAVRSGRGLRLVASRARRAAALRDGRDRTRRHAAADDGGAARHQPRTGVTRAWRRGAIALTVIAAVVVGAVAIRLALAPSPRTMRFNVPRDAVAVPGDAAALARGRHLSEAIAVCTVCHGDDLGGRLASSIRCSAVATRRT